MTTSLIPEKGPVRAMAVVFPDEPLNCPRGHRVPQHFWSLAAATGEPWAYRCLRRVPPGLKICDACVIILPLEGRFRVAVHVTAREIHEIESARMSIRDLRDFLDLRWMVRS